MTRQLKKTLLLRTTLLKTLSSEKENEYCHVLNLWLRKRCTREEFDLFVSKFLSETGIKLHTKFLSSLSKLCCKLMALPLLNNNGRLRKLDNVNNILLHKFVDKTLPSPSICCARFLVFAWGSGIISVSSQTRQLLHFALIVFLKDIIFTIMSVKKSYKVKANGFRCLETSGERASQMKLPSGFINANTISACDLILALHVNPGILKMGLSKYVEQIISGPAANNVTPLMPLSQYL